MRRGGLRTADCGVQLSRPRFRIRRVDSRQRVRNSVGRGKRAVREGGVKRNLENDQVERRGRRRHVDKDASADRLPWLSDRTLTASKYAKSGRHNRSATRIARDSQSVVNAYSLIRARKRLRSQGCNLSEKYATAAEFK